MKTTRCPECDELLIENDHGYVRGCEHYPVAEMNKFCSDGDRRLRRRANTHAEAYYVRASNMVQKEGTDEDRELSVEDHDLIERMNR